MKAQTIRIYLRHPGDPDSKFLPRPKVCTDYDNPRTGHLEPGCGATLVRFVTYPNEKGIYFDGPPRIVEGSEVKLETGAIVGSVYTDTVHFATCPMRQRTRAAG